MDYVQELDGVLDFPVYVREIGEKLSVEQATVVENRKYGEKTKQSLSQYVKVLSIILLCCVGVVMLASCDREASSLGLLIGDPVEDGEFLASIYITVEERHYVYEIFENIVVFFGDKNYPPPPEFYGSASGWRLTAAERRDIRRLLNGVLENERGSLGLLDSSTHVTIRQAETEIQFTHGMADVPESDELISKLLDFFIYNIPFGLTVLDFD